MQLSQSLLDVAGSAAQVGGWALKLPSRQLLWTEQTYRIFGLSEGQPLDVDDVLGLHTPEGEATVRASMERCITEGTPFCLELEVIRATGSNAWVRAVAQAERDESGSIVGVCGAVQDITDYHRSVAEIQRISDELRTTMQSITDALFTLDQHWRFTFVNARAEHLLQRESCSLLGRSIWAEFPETVGTEIETAYRTAMEQNVVTTVDEFYYPPLKMWVEVRVFPSTNGLTAYFRDITRRHENEVLRRQLLVEAEEAKERAQLAQLTLARQAVRDPLTGLYNRRQVTERLNTTEDTCTVLFIDLDRFKKVNDSLGHLAGDELLIQVARRLEPLVRPQDTLARLGGDEFVILTDLADGQAEALAHRVLEEVRRPIQLVGRERFITASIGIATAHRVGGADLGLRDADVALYRAKEAGRDQVACYDHEAHRQVLEQIRITDELREALRHDQLVLHYQPSFDAAIGNVVGAEALVRWQHPTRGLLPPGVFISAAEESGLIEDLGAWCLRTAIRQTSSAEPGECPGPVTWVNVSVNQLLHPGLSSYLEEELRAAGLPASHLGVEVTESAFGADSATVIAELEALSALGVPIAIDDFGTGYSSLWRLGSLPVDVIKIDRSFVHRLDTSPGRATVAAIIDLSHAVDASVIAEGVETAEQLQTLTELGCDTVSGYYLARPLPADQLPTAQQAGTSLIRTPPRQETPANSRHPQGQPPEPLERRALGVTVE